MSNVPADLRYTKDHEWIKVAADGTAVIGITDHAQAALGDLVFVEPTASGVYRLKQVPAVNGAGPMMPPSTMRACAASTRAPTSRTVSGEPTIHI